MELRKSSRSIAKIRLALQGPSGSGKTYSALLIALGLSKNFDRVAVIDTENHSSELYSHLGSFNVMNLREPFTPEKYVDAIKACEQASMDVIIIDSISHEWDGPGGILEMHSTMTGNSYTNWGKLTPRHNSFLQAILQSTCHIIVTIRSKQEYILSEKNGKQVPEKVGMKGITREGTDYEMTTVLELDLKHKAVATKDRTGLFMDKPEFLITEKTGETILNWCNAGATEVVRDEFGQQISSCATWIDLKRLYLDNPQYQVSHRAQFATRKEQIIAREINNNSSTENFIQNGTYSSK